MLPNTPIAAPNWDDWVNAADGSRITKDYPSNFRSTVITHKIKSQLIAGRWLYYRPDCEAAAVKIAAMRAERAAKAAAKAAAAQSVSP